MPRAVLLAACSLGGRLGAGLGGVVLVCVGGFFLVRPLQFDRAYELSMKLNPLIKNGGCLYEVNRVVVRYLGLTAFVVGGFVLMGAGIAGC